MHIPLTKKAHCLLGEHVLPGDIVIDATAGNGHDTLLLAELVGKTGQVFAFDKQAAAIESARSRIQQAGLRQRVIWLSHGHEDMAQHIPPSLHARIKASIFNLGYLPGGDKSHITKPATTLPALQQAFRLVIPGGLLSIIAYPGHPGGREETEKVKQWAATLIDASCEITIPPSKGSNAPEWVLIKKH